MSHMERVYSVLLVSAAEQLNQVLTGLMSAAPFELVKSTASVSAARRLLVERSFDIIIVNAPLPDDAGVQFALDAGEEKGTLVLLLVRSEQHSQVCAAVSPYGIFTLPRPCARQSLETALQWMASARERLRKAEEKTMSVEEKMEEITLVNRAKWMLIDKRGMSEPQAHRYIEKQAMDTCVSRRHMAEKIINMYSKKG